MSPKGVTDSHWSLDHWRASATVNQLSTALRDPNRPPRPPQITFEHGEIKRFIRYVLASEKWRHDSKHVIDLISLAIVPDQWPSPGFPALRQAAGPAATSGVCGKVWTKDVLAYKCKTCERDPTCVVCVQCFKNGDHAGHDYAMVRTSGGCCDCGDVQAWRPEGFCKHHRGAFPEDADPVASLPPVLQRSLREAVETVAIYVLSATNRSRHDTQMSPSRSDISHVSTLLDWLTEIVQIGDGIRRLVGLVLIAPSCVWYVDDGDDGDFRHPILAEEDSPEDAKFSWLSAMLQMDGADKLAGSLRSSLHALYFQLITDLVFKRTFLTQFVANYERYIHALIESGKNSDPAEQDEGLKNNIIENFTVQLFTVPALVPVMTEKGGLLDVLMDLLLNLFETWAIPVGLYSKAVPRSQSAYARKLAHEKDRASSSNPVASSSSSPPPRRRKHRLPVEFSTEEGDKKEIRQPNFMRWTFSLNQTGLPELRRSEVEEGDALLPEANDTVQVNADEQTGTAEASLQDATDGGSQGQPHDAEEALERHVQAVVAADEVMIIEDDDDGGGDEAFADVQEEPGLGAGIQGNADQPIHVEVDRGDGVEARLIVVLGNHTGETNPDNGDEDPGRVGDDDSTVSDQYTVFEEGLHFKPPTDARLSSTGHKESKFLSAVRKARAMANDAYDDNGPLAHTMRLNWFQRLHGERRLSEWVLIRVVNDLKYVLNHKEAAFHLLHIRRDLFRKFVRIMSMAQGMYPVARRFKDHIANDGDSWANSFTIEIEFYHYVELLAAAFCAHSSQDITLGEDAMDLESLDLRASRLECIRIVRACLDEWLEREEAIEARSVFGLESFTAAHAVTIHLPLHRFMAYMIHHVIRLDNIDVRTALGGGDSLNCSDDDVKRLLKHPLRIQSFLAQVRAGMWRRNGHPVVGQSMFYRSMLCSEWFIDLDLFLQQCCTAILGPNAFLAEVQEAFRISDLAKVVCLVHDSSKDANNPGSSNSQTQSNADDTQDFNSETSTLEENDSQISTKDIGFLPLAPMRYSLRGLFSDSTIANAGNTKAELAGFAPTLIEDMLTHIVRVAFERSRCGCREVEFLRRKLLHQLSSRERTHSVLYKACTYRICNDLGPVDEEPDSENAESKSDVVVENILEDIAHYIEPKGMDQGKYRIKDEMWMEFDPFSPHLSPRDRCSAEVQHAAACKRLNRKMQVIPSENVNLRPTFRQLADLRNLSIACSRKDGLATAVLQTIYVKDGGLSSLEGAVSAAIHLVCAAVEFSQPEAFVPSTYWLNDVALHGQFHESGPGIVSAMHNMATKAESNPFSEFMPVLERMVTQAYDRGDDTLRNILRRTSPSLISHNAPSSSKHLGSEDSLSPEQARRRAILRKKKEQQAAAMAKMRMAQERFARHINDRDEVTPSSQMGKTPHDDPVDTAAPTASEQKRTSGEQSESKMVTDCESSPLVEDRNLLECCLCHEVGCSGDNKFIGYIGFHQQTSLPHLARDDCEKRRPSLVDVIASSSREHKVDGPRERGKTTEMGNTPEGMEDQPHNRNSNLKGLESPLHSLMSGRRTSYFLNHHFLERGIEAVPNVHVSFCGHAIHIRCFERYFRSLLDSRGNQSVFEGYNIVNLDKMEFLCMVCRRLSNIVLPISKTSNRSSLQGTGWNSEPVPRGMPHLQWVDWYGSQMKKLCDFHVGGKDHLSRHSISGSTASAAPHDGQRRVTDPMSTNPMSVMHLLNRGKVVLQEHGLRGFLGLQVGAEGRSSEGEGTTRNGVGSYAKLPSVALSTAACAEIAARSESWNGQVVQSTRRSLSVILRESRTQILMDKKHLTQSLCELWREVHDDERSGKLDAFSVVGFLLLLWPRALDFYEAKNIVLLGYNLLQKRYGGEGSENEVWQVDRLYSTVLFLRRCAVLVSTLVASHSCPPLVCYRSKLDDAEFGETVAELGGLMDYFEIGRTDAADAKMVKAGEKKDLKDNGSVGFRPKRIGLVELPHLFQTLLEEVDGKVCESCGEVPKALCLVCGSLVCQTSNPCKAGKAVGHAQECGAGIGVFLLLKNPGVQIVRGDRTSSWGSPYLDMHGEEDKRFARGKLLYLNKGRYAALEQLWLLHGFDQDSRVLSNTMMPRNNQMMPV